MTWALVFSTKLVTVLPRSHVLRPQASTLYASCAQQGNEQRFSQLKQCYTHPPKVPLQEA
ncbi:hypothetical protein CBOM_04152 [Ceraceosorus bombacis]|uniref:Uncharacterized protein n=1 Tax=Ceraceosorus bombacis TaxID=401625 RepID=A0A0P1BPY8_9BASI|nr:hypothetical protein CBOM_04152 [Ceraceosorus bombacis]